jgi:hypothetical protein
MREKPGGRKQVGRTRKQKEAANGARNKSIADGKEIWSLWTKGAGSRRHYSKNRVVNYHANPLIRVSAKR